MNDVRCEKNKEIKFFDADDLFIRNLTTWIDSFEHNIKGSEEEENAEKESQEGGKSKKKKHEK